MSWMQRSIQRIAAVLALALAAHGPAWAQTAPKPQQFVYVLRVAAAFHDQAKWSQRETAAVGHHYARLDAATKAGQVIFAGRTSEPLDATFGLVVFEADSAAAARRFMESDPAVVAGVMTATLHPYVLALQRQP